MDTGNPLEGILAERVVSVTFDSIAKSVEQLGIRDRQLKPGKLFKQTLKKSECLKV